MVNVSGKELTENLKCYIKFSFLRKFQKSYRLIPITNSSLIDKCVRFHICNRHIRKKKDSHLKISSFYSSSPKISQIYLFSTTSAKVAFLRKVLSSSHPTKVERNCPSRLVQTPNYFTKSTVRWIH